MSDEDSGRSWETAVSNSFYAVNRLLTTQTRNDQRVIDAMKHAVDALNEVATECQVVQAEIEIRRAEEKVRLNRAVLKELGREK